LQNSSPRYNLFPPIYICANRNFVFDHTAIDPDNDSLAYSFYAPFQGIDPCCSVIGSTPPSTTSPGCPVVPASCPQSAPPPPYNIVAYAANYNGQDPIPAATPFSVNPLTGILTGKATQLGQYVVGVSVREFRDGKLINTHFRDFQFNVIACPAAVVSNMKPQDKLCEGSLITFTNTSSSVNGEPKAKWDFGVPGVTTDTSSLFNPSYLYPDTGRFVVTLIADPDKPCSDTSRREFVIYPQLDIYFAPHPAQCLAGNAFTFAPLGKSHAVTSFTWNFSANATPSVSFQRYPPTVSYKASGLHSASLRARHFACRDSFADTVRVVGQLAGTGRRWDTTIVIGQQVQLNADAGPGNTYTWSPVTEYLECKECREPAVIARPLKTITYTVLVEDYLHCNVEPGIFRVFVDAKTSIDVPSAFTPNGDGVNDKVRPAGWGLKSLLYFRIYNRWGQLLYETNDLEAGWDGRFNNVMQNIETYIYQVKAETFIPDQPFIEKSGTIELIR
jgi:gliding motility-associated-like protein